MAVEVTDRIFYTITKNPTKEDYYRSIHRSFLVSADMAHSVHPNYSEKHHPQHIPYIHKGIALKQNANQRYATDTISGAIVKYIAAKVAVPI